MFKILAFARRKSGTTIEEFRDHYESRHATLVNEIAPAPGPYRRNYLMRSDAAGVNTDVLDFDVVTEMEFVDRAAYEQWHATLTAPSAAALVGADLKLFIDPASFRVCAVDVRP